MCAVSLPSASRRTTLAAPILRATGVASSTRSRMAVLCGMVTMKPPRFCNCRSPCTTCASSAGRAWNGTHTPSKPRRAKCSFMRCGVFTWWMGSARMPNNRVWPLISFMVCSEAISVQQLARHGGDAVGVQPVMGVQRGGRRDQAVFVMNAVAAQAHAQAAVGQHLGHGRAQPAHHIVLFHRQHPAGGAGRGQHRVAVQRLDGGHVDHADRQAGLAQPFGGLQRRVHGDAAGDDVQVAAQRVRDGAAEPERRAIGVDLWIAASANAEVDGLGPIDAGLDGRGQLRAVGRRHHGQPGDARGGDVFGGMVRGAVEAQADAGVMTDQAHRQPGIGHVHADLLATQQAQEGREGGDEGHQPRGGHAGGGRDHVLFRDAELHIAFGKGGRVAVQAVRVLQVGRAGHDGWPARVRSMSASDR